MYISLTNTIGAIRTAIGIVRKNLQLWLDFERSDWVGGELVVKDKSPNTNNAKLFTGKALSFDGVNDQIDLGSQSATSDITIAMWLNLDDLSGSKCPLTIGEALVKVNNSDIEWYPNENSTQALFAGVMTVGWQRIVITQTSTSCSLYINGLLIESKAAVVVDTAPKNSYIGSYGSSTWFFEGGISDLQIYNKAWTEPDVAFDYNNPNHLAIDNPNTSLVVADLKGYWALSEGDGLVAYDSSGEGNNGTINGATYIPAQDTIPQLGMMDWAKGSNLIEYSEDFDNSNWTKSNITVTSSQVTNPSGGIGVGLITATTDDARLTTTTSLGGERTFSIYVKSAEVGDVEGQIDFSGLGIVSFTATDEWQRVSSTLNDVGTYKSRVRIDTDTESLYIWGAQLEESSSAGNYILTDRAAAIDVTTIQNPTNKGYDILGNALRLREHAFNNYGESYFELQGLTNITSITDGAIEFWLKTTDTQFILFSSDGTHYTAAYNGGDWFGQNIGAPTIYEDDELLSSPTIDGNWHYYSFRGIDLSTWTNFVFGDYDPAWEFDGLIDEVLIYSSLTSKESTQNYKAGINKHKATSSFSDDFSSDYGL